MIIGAIVLGIAFLIFIIYFILSWVIKWILKLNSKQPKWMPAAEFTYQKILEIS
jgi:hypothetical protein